MSKVGAKPDLVFNPHNHTILIIDDEPTDLAVVADYLVICGFQIKIAYGGESGLGLARRTPPDLVLLDVRLPGLDGFEVCRCLKADPATEAIPVIFMTAMTRLEDKVQGFEIGGVDYITKPFRREELLARVTTHLTLHQLQQELQDLNRSLEDRVTQRTADLARVNRMLNILNACNEAVVHATQESALLQDICRIIVDMGGYRLVWVAFAEQDEARSVRPVAYAGFEDGYLSTIHISWADNEFGRGPTGTAIRSRQVCILKDMQDPLYAPWRSEATRRGYASSIALPMLSDDRVLGALNIYAPVPDAFQAEEVHLLTELAGDLTFGMVALRTRAERHQAIEQVGRLNQDLERRARGLAALNQAGRARASTRDLVDLLELMLEQIKFLLDAEAASVLLCESASEAAEAPPERLVFAAATGSGADKLIGQRLPATAGLAGWVVREKQPVLVPDTQHDARFDRQMDATTGLTTHSLIAVPMMSKGVVLGVMEAINCHHGAFDEHDLDMLEALSGSGAIAIENARLYQAEKDQRELAETLREVGALLTAAMDAETILERILEQVGRAVPSDAANIMLIQDQYVRVACHRGYRPFACEDWLDTLVYPLFKMASFCRMLETGQPVVYPDTHADVEWSPATEMDWVRSYVGAPICVQGEVIGFLNVDSATPGFYRQVHAGRLLAFANQAALALQNARLFSSLAREKERLELLYGLGQQLASSLDVQEVMQRALDRICAVIGVQRGVIYICGTPESNELRLAMVSGCPAESAENLNQRFQLQMGAGLAGWVAAHRQSVLVNDVVADGRWIALNGLDDQFLSALCVPLVSGDELIGVLTVNSERTDFFNEEHRRLIESAAAPLATAMVNARLYAAEQQRAEVLAHALAQEHELDLLQREFIQNVSHELRTPLALIRGHAEVLEKGWVGELLPKQQDSISVIARRSQMLSKLVDDIVAILEIKAQEPAREVLDLGQLAQTLVQEFQTMAEKANLSLTFQPAADLRPVSGDALGLRRVLDNLIGNACKFTPAGGCVTVRIASDRDGLTLQVTDTGIGIPEDKLNRIFDRFYQVDGSAQRRYGGVGLGLALVREIVEAHGGYVTVTSQLSKGSTFSIWLPTT